MQCNGVSCSEFFSLSSLGQGVHCYAQAVFNSCCSTSPFCSWYNSPLRRAAESPTWPSIEGVYALSLCSQQHVKSSIVIVARKKEMQDCFHGSCAYTTNQLTSQSLNSRKLVVNSWKLAKPSEVKRSCRKLSSRKQTIPSEVKLSETYG